MTRQRSAKANRGTSRARKKRRKSRPGKSVLDKIIDIKSKEKTALSGPLLPSEGVLQVPSPVEGSWTERLRTLVRHAGVDRGSVEILSSDSSNSEARSSDNRSSLMLHPLH